MAEPGVWKQLSAESFSAYVDLASYQAGTQELPVNVVSAVPGVQVVDKSPKKVLVTLEPLITKDVPVAKRIEGSAGSGFVAGSVEFDPDMVTAQGPKSAIENLTEAIAVINLSGETRDFTKTEDVYAYDDQGEINRQIEFSESSVTAKVAIVKASNNKTVGIKVKTIGSPKSGSYVSEVSAVPSTVDITGPQSVVSEIAFVETEKIDLTNANSDIERDIGLSLPSGITLQSGSDPLIKISVKISDSEVSRELFLSPNFEGLDFSYMISASEPSQFRIIVSGKADLVNALKSGDVSLALDLRSRTAGIYNYDINPNMIKAPAGITVLSVLPSSLTATIERK